MNRTPLSIEALQSLLLTKWLGRHIHVIDQLESTNETALALAEQGASHGTVVVANSQTRGKGRFGRPWHSPENVNLYFSLILKKPILPALLSWIPLVTGVAPGRVNRNNS